MTAKKLLKLIEPVISAGVCLSNIAWNLKQAPGRTLSQHDCRTMAECSNDWDRALREFKEGIEKQS